MWSCCSTTPLEQDVGALDKATGSVRSISDSRRGEEAESNDGFKKGLNYAVPIA